MIRMIAIMEERPDLITDILIIGAGAAGMAASGAAASLGADVIVCDERTECGGILMQCIHSGFGLGRYGLEMTGPEYRDREAEIFRKSGAHYLPSTRVLKLLPDRTAVVSGPGGLRRIAFRECILAAGCRERPLASLQVGGTRPSGIYTAGEAQEMINIGHMDIGSKIFILGSGDIGLIMARRFTLLGKTVAGIAEIRDELGGMKRNRDNCVRAYDIPVYLESTVTEVHGYPDLTSVTLHHFDTDTDEIIECDTLITSLGLIPDRELAEPLRTEKGFPEWIHFCGNADHVHEIADSVSQEAEKLGRQVASSCRL